MGLNINFEVILSKCLHKLKINKCYDFISLTREGFGTLYFREGTIKITVVQTYYHPYPYSGPCSASKCRAQNVCYNNAGVVVHRSSVDVHPN